MKNLSKISLDQVSENQVSRSGVTKTVQSDAEGLSSHFSRNDFQYFFGIFAIILFGMRKTSILSDFNEIILLVGTGDESVDLCLVLE